MSSYIVSNTHISAIVRWAASNKGSYWDSGASRRYEITDNKQKVCQILLDANYKSVNTRYSENNSAVITYNPKAKALRPVEVIKACDCLAYQSCDDDSWDTSIAKAIVDSIRDKAIDSLPGYEDAAWEIQDPEEVAA